MTDAVDIVADTLMDNAVEIIRLRKDNERLRAEVERLHDGLLQAHEVLWNGRELGRDRQAAYDQAQAILHGLLYPEITALPPTR